MLTREARYKRAAGGLKGRGGLVIAVCLALAMTACRNEPVSVAATNNAHVPVALLFEHEGCRVYRFVDGGHERYYVKCLGAESATAIGGHQVSCGKNCWRWESDQIQTAEVKP